MSELEKSKYEENYLTAKEAALLSGYNSAYLTRLAQKGEIEAKKEGRRWFLRYESLKAYLKERDVKENERRELLKISRLEENFKTKEQLKTLAPIPSGTRRITVLSLPVALQSVIVVFLGIFVSVLVHAVGDNDLNMAEIKAGSADIAHSLVEGLGVEEISQTANVIFSRYGN